MAWRRLAGAAGGLTGRARRLGWVVRLDALVVQQLAERMEQRQALQKPAHQTLYPAMCLTWRISGKRCSMCDACAQCRAYLVAPREGYLLCGLLRCCAAGALPLCCGTLCMPELCDGFEVWRTGTGT